MDSIRNAASSVANTASTYIYGNQNEAATEPAAGGEPGKGTAEEPYDKGNEAPATTTSTTTGSTASETKAAESSEPTSKPSSEPSAAASGAGLGSTDPSTGADPASGQKPEQKQQGADRPNAAPTGAEEDAVTEKKDEGEAALKKKDPNDHSGEPMHMHDGSESKDKGEDGEHPGQEGGGKHGQEEGTGEEWIKTSGFKAEGGDFDAAKAGAGREADRLLETKGIKKDDRGAMVDDEGNSKSPERAKTDHDGKHGSKLDKLKEKLHIGSGKKL